MNNCLALFSVLALLVVLASQEITCLECYVCTNQEDNSNKCAETVKICDVHQDQCLTEVRWASTPQWSLTNQKQYYISKKCATKIECNLSLIDYEKKCDRISYNDWNCTTCCGGDKCNYYVTLAANSGNPSFMTLFASLLVGLMSIVISMKTTTEAINSKGKH